ncbi:MAG: DUF937 domain-containing protein, partial [Theionarchaea archaeon]|nr:DUF937 domain-containing protein [Theionarchaea archaeon]
KQYGGDVSKQLSSTLGIKQETALEMIPVVAPMILGGLKRQMEQHGGSDEQARVERVNHILNKYGRASVLDHVGQEFQAKAGIRKPDPRLGGLLGDSGVQAADAMSSRFNIDKGTAMKIIVMLAPLILGALSQKRDTGGVGQKGIAALIDQDGDDQILDDVAGMLFQRLMGSDSRSRKDTGVLGSLLGQIMQPRCPQCGSSVEKGMKFCPECGRRL